MRLSTVTTDLGAPGEDPVPRDSGVKDADEFCATGRSPRNEGPQRRRLVESRKALWTASFTEGRTSVWAEHRDLPSPHAHEMTDTNLSQARQMVQCVDVVPPCVYPYLRCVRTFNGTMNTQARRRKCHSLRNGTSGRGITGLHDSVRIREGNVCRSD